MIKYYKTYYKVINMSDYSKLIKKYAKSYERPEERVEKVLKICLKEGIEPVGNVFFCSGDHRSPLRHHR